ncbi:MAG: NAD(P)H-quinone oxidoreductase [Alphaproteobacteria bacterium]|nr:NAD(P)H-quinone oxidoreductase [Alphaproteobacteria bacterium]
MEAIVVEDGVCVLRRVPAPALPPGCVRISVRAAGVNRADLAQKAGRYPPPPGASPILGLEVSGVVTEVADGVEPWRPGDPVCALLAGGGYATEVVVDARHVLPLPPGVDHVGAAAVVEVFATAWLNLQGEGGLEGRTGARVLLHAGASGVGTAAIQLCRVLGHESFVVVGSDEKLAQCLALGASGGANRHAGPWLPHARAWRADGVDLVLDPVGADTLADDLEVLGTDGVLVVIGLLSGRQAPLDLGRLLVKRLRIQGSTLRSRSDAFKAELVATLRARVWPHFLDGTLRPLVHATFPLAEAEAAHALLASNATTGALVLEVPLRGR